MSWPDRDRLNRTAKQLIDAGTAATHDEAITILQRLVLQVRVGPNIDSDEAAQAALLTVLNAGQRAFLGGVAVQADDNPRMTAGWTAGLTLREAVHRYGGSLADSFDAQRPVLVIGSPGADPDSDTVLHLTWHGWSGGVVIDESDRLAEIGIPLAGVLAGAMGVSECFQFCLHSPVAARRAVGASLWRPDLNWRTTDAVGPHLRWLPTGLWLLGLGHLGQAYAWSLGMLPYATPSELYVYLMDTDVLVEGNRATGLLVDGRYENQPKTRVVSRQLETLGFRTSIVERRFDEHVRPTATEPGIALAGFDSPTPRRLLGDRFARVVDAGLGSGPVDYLDMLLHTFPSQIDPEMAFPDGGGRTVRPDQTAYRQEIDRRVAAGAEKGDATCGMAELAGITVGAAFVGATAGAFAVADVLRLLHGGPEFSVVALDLRSPNYFEAAPNDRQISTVNPGYTLARGCGVR